MELVSTIKKTELIMVKLRQSYDDGTEMKIEVPSHNLEDVETIFYCMDEFREAARRMSYVDDELFTHYRETLGADARATWDIVAADYPERTTIQFDSAFKDLVRQVVDEQAYAHLMAYLRTAVKPLKFTPKTLAHRVRSLCRYANDLPNDNQALPPLPESEIKRLIFNMMPMDWRNQFEKSNQHLSATTLPALMEYMTTLSSLEENKSYKRKGNGNGGGQSSQSPRKQFRFDSRYTRGGRGNRGRDHRGGNPGGRGRGGRSNAQRPQPDDTCPVHGSHPWKQCFLNPYGDSYRSYSGGRNSTPGRGRGHGGRNGGRNHGQNQNQNQAFYNDQGGSEDSRHDSTWSRPSSGGGMFAGGRFAHNTSTGGVPTSYNQSWYAQSDAQSYDNTSQFSNHRW
jgi:hypothetical protein